MKISVAILTIATGIYFRVKLGFKRRRRFRFFYKDSERQLSFESKEDVKVD